MTSTPNSHNPRKLIFALLIIVLILLSTPIFKNYISTPSSTPTPPIILSKNANFIEVKHSSNIQSIPINSTQFKYYQFKTDQILQSLNRKLFFKYSISTSKNIMQRSDYILVEYSKPIETTINNYGMVTFTEAIFIWDSEGIEPKYILIRKTGDFTEYDTLGFTDTQYSINAFQIQR